MCCRFWDIMIRGLRAVRVEENNECNPCNPFLSVVKNIFVLFELFVFVNKNLCPSVLSVGKLRVRGKRLR